jgi:DNA modification methylase
MGRIVMSLGEPFVQDEDFTLYVGDALETLRGLPDESVHCCVTSPPYWGLRDYGTAGQLGLEPTPEEYVARMVAVFREVRRVLRKDGTCWLNIGDSYAATPTGNRGTASALNGAQTSAKYADTLDRYTEAKLNRAAIPPGLKPKDLVGIPWRLAFALQADGWYLRSDIIWAKPNPMPESVTDRPTKAHEYLFLLTRSPRYFFDAAAVAEPAAWERWGDQTVPKHNGTPTGAGWIKPKSKQELTGESRPGGRGDTYSGFNERYAAHDPASRRTRNVRSVWEIATQPYAEAHFATFPEALVERCVKAGTSERGCCPVCGAPWEREVEKGESDYARLKREQGHEWRDMDAAGFERGVIIKEGEGGQTRTVSGTVPSLRAAERIERGWTPTCSCGTVHVQEVQHADMDAEPSDRSLSLLRPHVPSPAVILDPFLGSGTTALVARRLGRKSIGIELSPEYATLAARRLQQLSLLA